MCISIKSNERLYIFVLKYIKRKLYIFYFMQNEGMYVFLEYVVQNECMYVFLEYVVQWDRLEHTRTSVNSCTPTHTLAFVWNKQAQSLLRVLALH